MEDQRSRHALSARRRSSGGSERDLASANNLMKITVSADQCPAHQVLHLSAETRVVSITNCVPQRCRPAATTSSRRPSNVQKSTFPTETLVDTLAPATLQIRATALSKAKLRRPSTPALLHAARWWPKEWRRWPHRQVRETGGKGKRRRRRSSTRKRSASMLVDLFDGTAANAAPEAGPL